MSTDLANELMVRVTFHCVHEFNEVFFFRLQHTIKSKPIKSIQILFVSLHLHEVNRSMILNMFFFRTTIVWRPVSKITIINLYFHSMRIFSEWKHSFTFECKEKWFLSVLIPGYTCIICGHLYKYLVHVYLNQCYLVKCVKSILNIGVHNERLSSNRPWNCWIFFFFFSNK